MVDVTEKFLKEATGAATPTVRWAKAEGKVRISEKIRQILFSNGNGVQWNTPKGNVVQVARIAGIQAAKRTSHLIPLCHQVSEIITATLSRLFF